MTVGIRYLPPGNFGAALGLAGLDPGDTRAMAQAVVDDINANGGIVGRQVEPVFANAIEGDRDTEENEQTDCVRFTEDNNVIAAVDVGENSSVMLECMAQHNTPFVNNGAAATADDDVMRRYANTYFSPSSFNMTRFAYSYADGLASARFFSDDPVIGLVYLDDPIYKRVIQEDLEPALASHGFGFTEKAAFTTATQAASNMGPIVLRFRATGVNRVMFLEGEGMSLFFIQAAHAQDYHPRLGMSTSNGLAVQQGIHPSSALRDAVAIGWMPAFDVDAARDPGPTPLRARCLDIMRRRGVEFPTRLAESYALGYCDTLFLVKAGFDRAGTVTTDGLREGVELLGDSFGSASGFANSFSTDRHDGANEYRMIFYREECSCFRYEGGPRVAA